ncbi:MAG: PH domain-containing protein [Allosphingosinicella sp.]|uniref:PH domain-containing protein n=1 Tax=Allosphingosinicella sp. TaxID=2823234 RepID=UPI00393E6E7F
MTPLHPKQIAVLRIRYAIAAVPLFVMLLVAELWTDNINPLPFGAVVAVGLVLILVGIWRLPKRRYAAWGYRMEEDELAVRNGLLIRALSLVPFGRVQHIDLAQGPLERAFGLATLVLNTAGTRGAAIRLPGLAQADAEQMRDHIRGKIRQDLL